MPYKLQPKDVQQGLFPYEQLLEREISAENHKNIHVDGQTEYSQFQGHIYVFSELGHIFRTLLLSLVSINSIPL